MSDNQDINTDEEPKEKAPEGVSASAAEDGRKTVFVRHPVLPKIKKAITNQRMRILDARFAPSGAAIYDGETGKVIGGGKAKAGKPNKEA